MMASDHSGAVKGRNFPTTSTQHGKFTIRNSQQLVDFYSTMIIGVISEGREEVLYLQFWSGVTTLFKATKCNILSSQHFKFFGGFALAPIQT